jgi:restriction system protein
MGTKKESIKKIYSLYLLESILELGGSAKIPIIMENMYQKIGTSLSLNDLEKLPNRYEIRWQNKVAWTRADLILKGYLKKDSPRGVWEISDDGKKYCKVLKNQIDPSLD